jgi:hypothetical protein
MSGTHLRNPGLAEHLAMRDDRAAPSWSATRGLRRFWFPFDTPGAGAGARTCPSRVPQEGRVRRRLRDRRRVSEPAPLLGREDIEEAFRRLGDRLAKRGVPNWWLNEQASSYAAPGGDPSASRVFDHPGLRVFAASPERLLAMKALAARPRDAQDIRQLTEVLNLHRSRWVTSG